MGGVVDSIRSTLSETACCRTNTSTELPKERRTSTGAIRILTRPWAWDSTAESLRKVVLFIKTIVFRRQQSNFFFAAGYAGAGRCANFASTASAANTATVLVLSCRVRGWPSITLFGCLRQEEAPNYMRGPYLGQVDAGQGQGQWIGGN